MDLIWTSVSRYWVASLQEPVRSKNKRADVDGYEDLYRLDVPEEILQRKDQEGWTNFGKVKDVADTYIVGDNIATRLRIARAIKDINDKDKEPPDSSANRYGQGRHPEWESFRTDGVHQTKRDGFCKDGGVNAFFDSGTLYVQADRYDKEGADPDLIIEEIKKTVIDAAWSRDFLATVCLKKLWWSKGTYESRQESSNRCMKVFSSLFELGCRGLQGDLDLSANDLDDSFLEDFLRLLESHPCSLNLVNLDENRITTEGATQLLRRIRASSTLQGRRSASLRMLRLMNNPIDNCNAVAKVAYVAGVRCEVGPPWTWEKGKEALEDGGLWYAYFYGPAQLLRLRMLESRSQKHMVECPICHCVLKHDFSDVSSPQYTSTGNLVSHLTGNPHRKQTRYQLEAHGTVPTIFIASGSCSFTLHPVTGELQCFPGRRNSSDHATERGQDSHRVQVREEAKHVRAVIWPEGRKTLGEAQPQEACEILEELHWQKLLEERERRHRQKHAVTSHTQSQILFVGEIEYTQASIKAEFRDGRPLEQLISDLHRGKVDPGRDLELEVVEYGGKYYSNDNRRLYCLKEYQENVHWNVKVAAKVYVFPKAFERFVDRYTERRQLVGDDNRDIRVRGQWRRW